MIPLTFKVLSFASIGPKHDNRFYLHGICDGASPAQPDHDEINKGVYEQYLMKDVEVDREEVADAVNQRMRRGW